MSTTVSPHSPAPAPINYDSDLEFLRMNEVEAHFLRTPGPLRHSAMIEQVSGAMYAARIAHDKMTLIPTPPAGRLLVIADVYATQLGLSDQINPWGYITTRFAAGIHSTTHAAPEWIQFGNHTVVTCQKVTPHQNHTGDCLVVGMPSYDRIWGSIQNITNQDPEIQKKLAALLLSFPKSLTPISEEALSQALHKPVTANECDFLNRLCYLLFIKEVTRRQKPHDTETHLVPWATTIIRSLKLAASGHISLKDVLSKNAPYGITTGENIGKNMSDIHKKIRAINRLYRQHFPDNPLSAGFHNPLIAATPRHHLRQELGKIYGGASDTDSAGYESL